MGKSKQYGISREILHTSGNKIEACLVYSTQVCTNSTKQAGSCAHGFTDNCNIIILNLFVGQTCRSCIVARIQGTCLFSVYPLFFSFLLIVRNFHFQAVIFLLRWVFSLSKTVMYFRIAMQEYKFLLLRNISKLHKH